MCLTKIPTQGIFKILPVLVLKVSALRCFLNGFGIAVQVFSNHKRPTQSSIV